MSWYKTINDDCAVALATLESESIDLTVTSPPYDSLRDYDGFTFDFPTIAEQLYRVTKQGGIVVWVVNDATVNGSETGTSFRQALGFKDVGFSLHDTMIWVKTGGGAVGPTNAYSQNIEYMFVLSKGAPKTANLICDVPNKSFGKAHSDVGRRAQDGSFKTRVRPPVKEFSKRNNWWQMNNADNHDAGGHPAVFPRKLAHDHIVTWSNEGDTILDPFMGSGTTGLVCAELKRDFIGIEISERWYEYATDRLNVAYSQLALF